MTLTNLLKLVQKETNRVQVRNALLLQTSNEVCRASCLLLAYADAERALERALKIEKHLL